MIHVESYIPFQESFDTFDPLGAAARLAGSPRMWGVTATYRFN